MYEITKEKEGGEMSLEKLSQDGFIHEVKEVSSGPHSSKFCFVLGAGASKTSGIKTGQELVDRWEKEMLERDAQSYLSWKKKNKISDENKYSFYSQYYEERYKKRPIDGLNFLEKMMENVNPNVGYVVLAHLLAETDHNVVITTNFDHLLEDALNYYEKSLPLVIGHESLAHYIKEHIERPTIIKIHRDLLFDPKNTVKDVGVLHNAWKNALDIIFSEFHPIFIGYAGNDKSLMDYLTDNIEKFRSGKWKFPYWTLYRSEILPEGKVKEFLEGAGGYYIKCNGFDELLCRLGAELGYRMPEEEQFLEDTRIRYHQLCEAFGNMISPKATDDKQEEAVSADAEETNTVGAVQQITSQTGYEADYFSAIRLHNEKNFEAAIEIERKLLKRDPKNARYCHLYGTTLGLMKKFDEAETAMRKAVEFDPEKARYFNSLGDILHLEGKHEDAEKAKREAVRLEPENAGYHIGLCVTLREMERYAEAEKEAREAVELEPGNARCHACLGRTFYKMDRYEEAEIELEKAVEIEPNRADYQEELKKVREKLK